MCRWLAYAGQPVYLEQLLLQPERSLIDQAIRSRKSLSITNGDGFGVGWYGPRAEPGLYRDDRPAWNDDNLRNLAAQIVAPLVFAHVRAATAGSSSRHNCHPFRLGRWLFMHNGQIGGYEQLARDLEFALAPQLYRLRQGATDSETLFLLAATFMLEPDPLLALARAAGFIEHMLRAHAVAEPFRMTAALSDGQRIWAVRHASDRASPTLFYARAADVHDGAGRCCLIQEAHPSQPLQPAGAASDAVVAAPAQAMSLNSSQGWVLASEPLDGVAAHWTQVPEGHAVCINGAALNVSAWAPMGLPEVFTPQRTPTRVDQQVLARFFEAGAAPA